MRQFMIVIGIIVLIVLLLGLASGPAQAGHVGAAGSIADSSASQTEDTASICLALVGGTALLAGIVWMGMLRRLSQ